MNINDSFPSNWLKSADLQGRAVQVQISHVTEEDIGDGVKPVLYLQGKVKGVVLNKTNASMIANSYGDETEAWEGKPLEIYPDKTQFQGKIVDCIRVRVPAPEPEVEDDGTPAEIPF